MGAVLTLTLASCGGGSSLLPSASLKSQITPGVGFDVDTNDAGEITNIVLVQPSVRFFAQAGSTGATVERYSVEYFNSAGQEIIPSGNQVSGTMNVRVQPGRRCTSEDGQTPLVGDACTLFSKNLDYAPGPPSDGPSVALLPGSIARAYLESRAGGQNVNDFQARVTFSGRADNGSTFSFTDSYNIIHPLRLTAGGGN